MSGVAPRMFAAFGKLQSMQAWAREYGLSYFTIYDRVNRWNIPLEVALTMRKQRNPLRRGVRRRP